jgi:hypothetical protein
MRTSPEPLTTLPRLTCVLSIFIAFALIAASAGAATPGGAISQFGAPGSGNGQFNGPSGVAIDSAGDVYVVDTGNDRVQRFTSEGVYVSQFGAPGSGDGQFIGPRGVAIDSAGDVYVVDTGNDRVQRFTSEGVYVSQFGTAGAGNGQINAPTGVAIDSAGNVYVADAGNGRAQKFSPEGNFISVLDTDGSQVVAVDSSENVYVLDRRGGSPSQIDVYNGAGALTYTLEAGDISSSHGLAVSSTGEAFVSDATTDDVVRFTRPEGVLPVAVTEGAFGALATTVTVAGRVEAQASTTDTTYRFEYGPTTAYGQSAPLPAGDLGGASLIGERVVTALTGLGASTTDHYRLVVSNVGRGGSAYGGDRTFTTVVLAPAVDTAPPSVAATTATLTGGVLPQGLDTTYRFEYGPTASYGASAPAPDADAGSGTVPQSVTQGISGLTPDTTYHYRLVATSVGGTTYGADQAFTTYAPGAATGGVSPFGAGVVVPPPPSYPDLSGLGPTPASPTAPGHPRKCGRGFIQKRVHGKPRCVKRHRHRLVA